MNSLLFIKHFYNKIATIGFSQHLTSYERERVLVFNQLNFVALIFSTVKLFYIFIYTSHSYSWSTFFINGGLSFFFLVLMWFMHRQYFKLATISSFLIVPPLIALVTWVSKDEGMAMFVINYMMFCFFFLRRVRNSLIAFVYCFIIFLIIHFKLEKDIGMVDYGTPNFNLTVFNYVVAFIMFFATLSLIKYQVWTYEKSIKNKSKDLEERNMEIEIKNDTLKLQSDNLEEKAKQLTILNKVKTKIFSVISHDLRTSIYSFKNIIDTHKAGYITNEELLNELPDLSSEIDTCTDIMDNLLNWGRDQFKDIRIMPESLNVHELVNIAFKLIKGRCAKKQIVFSNAVQHNVFILADRQMMQVVIRNLISNAVKFTPVGGSITVSAKSDADNVKILVRDTGIGISNNDINKFLQNKFFSNEGTSNEIGTGLGLIICKDFIYENNGELGVEANEDHGSTFIITMPLYT
jgi:two-component system sensor histidine kinase/response regulator